MHDTNPDGRCTHHCLECGRGSGVRHLGPKGDRPGTRIRLNPKIGWGVIEGNRMSRMPDEMAGGAEATTPGLPLGGGGRPEAREPDAGAPDLRARSEEHTSELPSLTN